MINLSLQLLVQLKWEACRLDLLDIENDWVKGVYHWLSELSCSCQWDTYPSPEPRVLRQLPFSAWALAVAVHNDIAMLQPAAEAIVTSCDKVSPSAAAVLDGLHKCGTSFISFNKSNLPMHIMMICRLRPLCWESHPIDEMWWGGMILQNVGGFQGCLGVE